MKKLAMILTAVITMLSFTTVPAQNENAKKQKPTATERAQKLTERMNKKLGFSARQYQEVYAINLRAAEKKVALESQLGNDKKQLGIKKREVEAQRDAELKTALSPEQFAKWTHWKEEKKQKMKEKHGKGHSEAHGNRHGKGKGKGKGKKGGDNEQTTSAPAPIPQSQQTPVPVGTTPLPAPGTPNAPKQQTPVPVGTTTIPAPGTPTPTQPAGSGSPTSGRGLVDDGTNGVDASEVDELEMGIDR